MVEAIAGQAYRLEPVDDIGDDYTNVYDKDGWRLGYVKQNDVVVSTDLDANTQKIVKRWFAGISDSVELAWAPTEHLKDVTGYATQEDAVNALVNCVSEW